MPMLRGGSLALVCAFASAALFAALCEAGDGDPCTYDNTCDSRHICVKGVCEDIPEVVLIVGTGREETAPEGSYVYEEEDGLPEKASGLFSSSAPNKLACKQSVAYAYPMTLTDMHGHAIRTRAVCAHEGLYNHGITVSYYNSVISVKMRGDKPYVGFVFGAGFDIDYQDVHCNGVAPEMVARQPTGDAQSAWAMFGPVFDQGPFEITCKIKYPLSINTGPTPLATLFAVTPMRMASDGIIDIVDFDRMPVVPVIPVGYKEGTEFGDFADPDDFRFGVASATLQPRANGCKNREMFKGFEQTVTVEEIREPRRSDGAVLDADSDGIVSYHDLQSAFARDEGNSVSVCSLYTDKIDRSLDMMYKQVKPDIKCFWGVISRDNDARLVPCHEDVADSPQAEYPPRDNIYRTSFKVPSGHRAYPVFVHPTYARQHGVLGPCDGSHGVKACTDDEDVCLTLDSSCTAPGVHVAANTWAAVDWVALTAMVAIITSVATKLGHHIRLMVLRSNTSSVSAEFQMKNLASTSNV